MIRSGAGTAAQAGVWISFDDPAQKCLLLLTSCLADPSNWAKLGNDLPETVENVFAGSPTYRRALNRLRISQTDFSAFGLDGDFVEAVRASDSMRRAVRLATLPPDDLNAAFAFLGAAIHQEDIRRLVLKDDRTRMAGRIGTAALEFCARQAAAFAGPAAALAARMRPLDVRQGMADTADTVDPLIMHGFLFACALLDREHAGLRALLARRLGWDDAGFPALDTAQTTAGWRVLSLRGIA